MSVTAVGEDPDREPTIADLLEALRQFEEQTLAGFAEIRRLFRAQPHPEKLPDGLDELPPMRGFMVDEDDGE